MLGDFDGAHTRRWLRVFVERGHEVHAVSFYAPGAGLPGVSLHVLKPGRAPLAGAGTSEEPGRESEGSSEVPHSLPRLLPPSLLRPVHALRYFRAGLKRVLHEIAPDVFHAHYVVEHGFYGSFAGFHPYVVSAWGSDLFQAARTAAGRVIARHALHAADLVSVNDPALGERALQLGVRPERLTLVRLGVGPEYLEGPLKSVNITAAAGGPPTVISDRALEPLYNVDVVVRAFARARERVPAARLLIAGRGSERTRLAALVSNLGQEGPVRFLGHVDQVELRRLLRESHVYVSVPSSDSLSASTMEAMACGALPVVSDLASQTGWISHRVNGLCVPVRDVEALADSLVEALTNAALRRNAVAPNRAKVAAEGSLEKNMLLMERHYYRLAGRPLAGNGI